MGDEEEGFEEESEEESSESDGEEEEGRVAPQRRGEKNTRGFVQRMVRGYKDKWHNQEKKEVGKGGSATDEDTSDGTEEDEEDEDGEGFEDEEDGEDYTEEGEDEDGWFDDEEEEEEEEEGEDEEPDPERAMVDRQRERRRMLQALAAAMHAARAPAYDGIRSVGPLGGLPGHAHGGPGGGPGGPDEDPGQRAARQAVLREWLEPDALEAIEARARGEEPAAEQEPPPPAAGAAGARAGVAAAAGLGGALGARLNPAAGAAGVGAAAGAAEEEEEDVGDQANDLLQQPAAEHWHHHGGHAVGGSEDDSDDVGEEGLLALGAVGFDSDSGDAGSARPSRPAVAACDGGEGDPDDSDNDGSSDGDSDGSGSNIPPVGRRRGGPDSPKPKDKGRKLYSGKYTIPPHLIAVIRRAAYAYVLHQLGFSESDFAPLAAAAPPSGTIQLGAAASLAGAAEVVAVTEATLASESNTVHSASSPSPSSSLPAPAPVPPKSASDPFHGFLFAWFADNAAIVRQTSGRDELVPSTPLAELASQRVAEAAVPDWGCGALSSSGRRQVLLTATVHWMLSQHPSMDPAQTLLLPTATGERDVTRQIAMEALAAGTAAASAPSAGGYDDSVSPQQRLFARQITAAFAHSDLYQRAASWTLMRTLPLMSLGLQTYARGFSDGRWPLHPALSGALQPDPVMAANFGLPSRKLRSELVQQADLFVSSAGGYGPDTALTLGGAPTEAVTPTDISREVRNGGFVIPGNYVITFRRDRYGLIPPRQYVSAGFAGCAASLIGAYLSWIDPTAVNRGRTDPVSGSGVHLRTVHRLLDGELTFIDALPMFSLISAYISARPLVLFLMHLRIC